MAAEFRLVRPDGGPLDLADDVLERYGVLGVRISFERLEAELPRAILVEATEGMEETGQTLASELASELGLIAVDLTAGAPLKKDARAPWWAYWRGR